MAAKSVRVKPRIWNSLLREGRLARGSKAVGVVGSKAGAAQNHKSQEQDR